MNMNKNQPSKTIRLEKRPNNRTYTQHYLSQPLTTKSGGGGGGHSHAHIDHFVENVDRIQKTAHNKHT